MDYLDPVIDRVLSRPFVARLNDPGVQKVNSSAIEITTVATVRFVRVPNMRIQPSAKQAIEF